MDLVNKIHISFEKYNSFLLTKLHTLWDVNQFKYFFNSLQYLYFNSLTEVRSNKVFLPINLGSNSYVTHLVLKMESLRVCIEPDYKREKSLEEFLISNYVFLYKHIGLIEIKKTKNVSVKGPFDKDKYLNADQEYFSPLVNIFDKHLELKRKINSIDCILLTNSLVSMDYVKGFSDADCVVILNESAYDNVKSIKLARKHITELSKCLYLFDPLQHHGFFIVNRIQMSYYSEAIYPLLLFENALNFGVGDIGLEFKCIDDDFEKDMALYNSLNSLFRYANISNDKYRNMFLLKRYISTLTLLPVLYAQRIGDYIGKKDAFDLISELFGSDEELFNQASHIRKTFPYKRKINSFPQFLHPSLINQLHGNLFKSDLWFDMDEFKLSAITFLDNFVDNYVHQRL